MLTLSIQQPWAWLIARGYKDVENRTWKTNVRGFINIHAGKTFDREGYDFVRLNFPQIPMPEPNSFERGGIIGEVEIVNCVGHMDSSWFFGPFGFVLAQAHPVKFKPCRGKLGFFKAEILVFDSQQKELF